MPIRINLKELFASDAQEMFIDKTNFNFNKLLELGIGDPGVQGLTGLTGSAGPSGNQGGQGQRGNKWFVGIGDPTSQVFTDLIENDFYLDTDASSIWQYQGSPASWIEIADLSEIVTNIIINEGAPFVRGFGEASPLDDRYILFTKRGNDLTDVTADTSLGNDANNDILLLNNWNERFTDISDFPMDTSSEYNAIQQISVDHTVSALGRYHLELGSLYTTPATGANILLSTVSHNLKVKYTKDTTGSTLYPISNAIINTAEFSMSKPVTALINTITEQGMFKFTVPKYNDDDGPAVRDEVFLRIGTTEALSEDSLLSIVSDGLEIRSVGSVNDTVSFGMKRELESSSDILTLNPSLYGNFGIIDTSSTLNGLMIKGDTYHTLGNLSHIQTSSEFEYSELDTFNTAISTQGQQGIFSDGQYLFAVSPGNSTALDLDGSAPLTAVGMMKVWDISNPDRPIQIAYEANFSTTTSFGPPQTTFDNNGNPDGNGPYPGLVNFENGRFNSGPPLTGVRDVAFAGKYGCYVRKRPIQSGTPPGGSSYNYDTFVMFELDSTETSIKYVSSLGTSADFAQFMTGSTFIGGSISPYFDDLRRVKISGNWAYVMSSRSLLNGTAATNSYFMAVDITAPTRPRIDLAAIYDMSDHINVDFDIHDNIAYILSTKWTASDQYELTLTKKQLFPQSLLNGGTDENEQNLIPLTVFQFANLPVNGSVKVIGNKLYLVWGNRFHIYDTKQSVLNDAILLDEYIDVDSEFRDIEISGNYAYVLTEPSTGGSQIVTFDISDPDNILRITPTSTAVTNSPSRMTLTGNRIFSIYSDGNDGRGRINSTKITGIESSVGRIGSLQSDHIKVSNDVSISQTLQVGRSATIGSGGLWVDQGTGIHSEGVIVSKMPSSVPTNNAGAIHGMSTIASGVYPTLVGDLFGTPVAVMPGIIGNSIYLEKIGNNTTNPLFVIAAGPTIGTKISLSDIDISNTEDIYGVKIDISSFTTTTGTSYGIHIQGADANLLEGTTTINDVLQLTPRPTVPTGSNGMMYYDSTTDKLMLYAASTWVALN